MKFFRIMPLLFALLLPSVVWAEVTVLVHGYLGDDHSWSKPGILDILSQHGRKLAGIYYYSPQGVRLLDVDPQAVKPVYTVNLPSIAPIGLQADWLKAFLDHIRQRHPGTPITLVGHSAGGVVARMLVVRDHPEAVTHLITIASPHFGTGRAYQALDAISNRGLFSPIRHWAVRRHTGGAVYNTLKASRGVLYDLTPPRPGNLLYWLNHQPHPPIRYTSIIRTGTVKMPGDHVVPPTSQDLRRLPMLKESAESYTMAQGHFLTRQDGYVLANLLDQAARTDD